MAVAIDLERGRSLDADVFLTVYGHEGHGTEHVEGVLGACRLVVGHVVGQLVDVVLDEFALGRHRDVSQVVGHRVDGQRVGLSCRGRKGGHGEAGGHPSP